MKNSIRTKITLMVVSFSVFIMAISWIICNYVISVVFVYNIKANLKTTFESCNELFSDEDTGESGEGLIGRVKNPLGAVIFVFSEKNGNIYTTIRDEGQMMQSMNAMLGSLERTESKGSCVPGSFTVGKHKDDILGASYYDLVGTLDNGDRIILRTPVERLELTMQVVTRVFIYVAVGLILIGSGFMLILSNLIANPIKRLSRAARRMTNLEFDVKVPVTTQDEIGELGGYMNEMSKKLEKTISELKSANLELEKDIAKKEELDDMRREFLSHVSHDLKTPIALIQGYAEGLKENMDDDPENREYYTDVIIDEAGKMNLMVQKLLSLNEIEFGANKPVIGRFELTGFVRDVLNSQKILMEEAGATLVYEEEDPVFVWADEFMIEEVLGNYLTNAIHYVKKGGRIRVWFERREQDVRVNVYNDGDLIKDEDIDNLFIKFYKADKARTREYGGNGIGLSIVAATMESHGKAYGVYNMDSGVCFYFDLDTNVLDEQHE